MAKTDAIKRPLLETGVHTEFGPMLDDPSVREGQTQPDFMFTPGFSDARIARDVALGELSRGAIRPQDVPVLKGNVRLVRRSKTNGTPDATKQTSSANRGYKFLTDADIGPGKIVTSVPPTATKMADGTFTVGDCVYMVCDQQQAARNAYRKAQDTAARMAVAGERAQAAGVQYDSRLMEALDGNPASKVQVT
jgi:hypothetical protein